QGMRAESGAIYKFKINEENSNFKINTSVVGDINPVGICGSGYIDLVSELLKHKLINKNGRLLNKDKIQNSVNEELVNRIEKCGMSNKFIIFRGDEDNNEVCINQEDISQLQLAKGAVRAGIEILLEKMEISKENLDGILLAGAFGSNIDVDSAIQLGIIPRINKDKIIAVGNAAGSGGIKSVLSKDILNKSIKIHSKIEHVELSLHKDFSSIFAKGMTFEV
ncbi:MAG: ASKHA domain-containing protein, partial [Peptostreptococcaceae bacterium]